MSDEANKGCRSRHVQLVIVTAIIFGHREIVKEVWDYCIREYGTDRIFIDAIISTIMMLKQEDVYPEIMEHPICYEGDEVVLGSASHFGLIPLMRYLLDVRDLQPELWIINGALDNGQFAMAQYLFDRGIRPGAEQLESAASTTYSGYAEDHKVRIISWLLEHTQPDYELLQRVLSLLGERRNRAVSEYVQDYIATNFGIPQRRMRLWFRPYSESCEVLPH